MDQLDSDSDRAGVGQFFHTGYDARPRADEPAYWTLIGAVGQFVVAGWCLSMAALTLAMGFVRLRGSGGLPSWTDGLLALVFIAAGTVLLAIAFQFLRRSGESVWVAWRKTWFHLACRRHLDADRAAQAAEGDPVLEPYLRHLVQRGAVRFEDRPPDEPRSVAP